MLGWGAGTLDKASYMRALYARVRHVRGGTHHGRVGGLDGTEQ